MKDIGICLQGVEAFTQWSLYACLATGDSEENLWKEASTDMLGYLECLGQQMRKDTIYGVLEVWDVLVSNPFVTGLWGCRDLGMWETNSLESLK